MIEHTVIDGRPATIAYIGANFEPADQATAHMVKVLFDDGQMLILQRGGVEKYDPDQPRKPKGDPEGGQWTDGGAGASKPKQLTEMDLDKLAPQYDKLPSEYRAKVKDAVNAYTGLDYVDVNDALRSGDKLDWAYGKYQQQIRYLDRAFQVGHELAHDTIVYRGMPSTSRYADLKVGDIFVDRAFVSTSPSERVAEWFSSADPDHEPGSRMPGTMLRIKVPKGTRVIAPIVPDRPGGTAEPELLLRRGTRFRVTREKSSGTIHLEVAGHEG